MSGEDDHLVVQGRKLSVEFGVLDNGSMPAKEFLDSLDERDIYRLVTILKRAADHGVLGVNNKTIFRQERDFWAAKHNKCKRGPKGRTMVRLVAYLKHDRLILTHGFWKPPQGPWPEKEFLTAAEYRDEINAREKRENPKGRE